MRFIDAQRTRKMIYTWARTIPQISIPLVSFKW